MLDVKPFVLRFWESEFKEVLVPVRTPSGQRAYTENNVALVREIKRLLYDEGLTIEGAKKRLLQPQASPPAQAPQPHPERGHDPRPGLPAFSLAQGQFAAEGDPAAMHAADQQANLQAKQQAVLRAEAQHATLSEVARELRAIRDLLR